MPILEDVYNELRAMKVIKRTELQPFLTGMYTARPVPLIDKQRITTDMCD